MEPRLADDGASDAGRVAMYEVSTRKRLMTSSAATETEIRGILKNMLEEERSADVETLDRNAALLLTLQLDSLDAVDLAMELKRRFGVDFSEADTFDATLASVATLVQERSARPL
jgi:acyl carrier protein